MENQDGSENVPRWENMDKYILSNIFKKHHDPNLQASDSRYQLRKIITEINKFARTVPNSFFFNVYCSVAEEDLAIISNGMPNIQKLALPMWTSLYINSIQSAFSRGGRTLLTTGALMDPPLAFSKWQNLQTLIIHPSIAMTVREVSSVELQAIGENCRNLTTMKFTTMLSKDLANIIVCNFPSLERLSFRCNYACIDASISLIIGLPNLRIFNLSHCIFTQNTGTGKSGKPVFLLLRFSASYPADTCQGRTRIGRPYLRHVRLNIAHLLFIFGPINMALGMRPKDELVHAGTKKLVRFMVCCSDCTICQDVWKHANNLNRYGLEFRYVNEEWWKTDEIKELEL
ncbi:hypothetical protein IGI04_011468 [Brassica rapa subsp. trilocularis]|uniref:FBD domain-containing protein n=1 Tax=Brassica rapa subsp. trilocularis TaxID=1813537 RepID=A0ABQ7N355_BRACM|nr:hypothetical protein IGI04_011468 [Brassica rapa subsp. trilocularis]